MIDEVLSAFDAITKTPARSYLFVDETGDAKRQSDGGHRFVISQRTTANGEGGDQDLGVMLAPLEGAPGI